MVTSFAASSSTDERGSPGAPSRRSCSPRSSCSPSASATRRRRTTSGSAASAAWCSRSPRSVFASVGALIVARVEHHRIGWIFWITGLSLAVGNLAFQYADQGLYIAEQRLPGATFAAWLPVGIPPAFGLARDRAAAVPRRPAAVAPLAAGAGAGAGRDRLQRGRVRARAPARSTRRSTSSTTRSGSPVPRSRWTLCPGLAGCSWGCPSASPPSAMSRRLRRAHGVERAAAQVACVRGGDHRHGDRRRRHQLLHPGHRLRVGAQRRAGLRVRRASRWPPARRSCATGSSTSTSSSTARWSTAR